MTEDYWFEQRYQDTLFSDHENGHPGRNSPLKTCIFCAPVDENHTCITKERDG